VFLGRRSDADGAALVTAAGFHWLTLPGPAVGDAGLAHDGWLPVTPEQDAADTVAVLDGRPLHAVVVDHYALDARWHDAVRRATGVALVAIDDLADRPLAVDLLVDPNPAADHAAKWHAVLRRPARLCTGPAHALLDRAYRRQPARPWHDRVACIGIFMGGTDPGAHSELAWLACRAHAGWTGPIESPPRRPTPACPRCRSCATATPACAWSSTSRTWRPFTPHTTCRSGPVAVRCGSAVPWACRRWRW
jgi:UDP-2,4-diacetamido-2,4,6-trideoxy-beta-L-altropyranose hydrolase